MQLTNKHKRVLRGLVAYMAVGFVLLTIFVTLFPTSFIDREFSEEVQETSHPVLDSLMKAVSWLGNPYVAPIMVILVAAAFLLFKFKREALFILLTMLSGLISTSLKMLINRPRPSENLVRIIEKARQQSFPSGHVLFFVLFFGFLILLMFNLTKLPKTLRVAVVCTSAILICAVSFSRIYIGAHWFTDVLSAFLLGLVCLYILGYYYLRRIK